MAPYHNMPLVKMGDDKVDDSISEQFIYHEDFGPKKKRRKREEELEM